MILVIKNNNNYVLAFSILFFYIVFFFISYTATHIVKSHQRKPTDESMKPELSREQLQRYIKFARSFNPIITPEAQDVMVHSCTCSCCTNI